MASKTTTITEIGFSQSYSDNPVHYKVVEHEGSVAYSVHGDEVSAEDFIAEYVYASMNYNRVSYEQTTSITFNDDVTFSPEGRMP